MIFWIDAQLIPRFAKWLSSEFQVVAKSLRDLGLRNATDQAIFDTAHQSSDLVVIVTKDEDFVNLVTLRGAPPKIIWVTCGNTSNALLMELFSATFADARIRLDSGDDVVEIG